MMIIRPVCALTGAMTGVVLGVSFFIPLRNEVCFQLHDLHGQGPCVTTMAIASLCFAMMGGAAAGLAGDVAGKTLERKWQEMTLKKV